MRLSKTWTSELFFNAAFREIGYDPNSPILAERWDLINQAIEKVYNLFYGLMSNSYQTPVGFNAITSGNHSTSGTGTWAALTGTLVFAGMRTIFYTTDVEKLIVFRIANNIYCGYIDTYVSTTSVTVRGLGLPTNDSSAVASVEVVNTIPIDELILTGLSINRTAMQKIVLNSSVTNQLQALSEEAFKNFQSASASNKNRIAYCMINNTIQLKKGDSLSSFGTMTLNYPRMPIEVTQDSDYIDIPDGTPAQMALNQLKKSLALRLKPALAAQYDSENAMLVVNMYKSFDTNVSFEVIKDKIGALQ